MSKGAKYDDIQKFEVKDNLGNKQLKYFRTMQLDQIPSYDPLNSSHNLRTEKQTFPIDQDGMV